MALFTYKAIDTRGKTMLGQIDAVNLVDLEQRLKRMGLDLVRGGPTGRGGSWLRSGSIKRSELINFCFHMEQLIGAGVPLVESLIDLRDSIENARFREVISGVIESIQGPAPVAGARAISADIRPGLHQPDPGRRGHGQAVRSAEEPRRQPQMGDELAEHVKKLIMYPAFVGRSW
jgi:type IV pilus assembly protein PilC